MKIARTLLIAGATTALAFGSAFAADKTAKKDTDPGFNKLDTNHDGSLSRTEAAKNPYLLKRFKQADRNGDGKLSRTEYLMTMTAQDARSAKKKVESAMDHNDNKQSGAGGTGKSK